MWTSASKTSTQHNVLYVLLLINVLLYITEIENYLNIDFVICDNEPETVFPLRQYGWTIKLKYMEKNRNYHRPKLLFLIYNDQQLLYV